MKILKGFWKPSNKNLKKATSIERVTIFGYSDAMPNDKLFKEVAEVTKSLAQAGYIVVDGGGPGVMRAATFGAKEGGGKVIGVTLYDDTIPDFEGKDPKNMFDQEIKTKTFVERTLALMRTGQVYVCFRGGTGTISEFGMAWGLAKLYFGHHKPLILYGNFWKKIIKAFKDNMLLRPHELKVYKIVDSPQGVLSAINEFEGEIARGEHTHLQIDKEGFSI